MRTLRIFAAALALTVLSSCASWTMPGGATETALCQIWGESLPTRSRRDTAQTQQEIQAAYADFLNACPDWVYLVN
jgi:hypothetical protein